MLFERADFVYNLNVRIVFLVLSCYPLSLDFQRFFSTPHSRILRRPIWHISDAVTYAITLV
jgi:hypothetical protein